MKIWCFFQINLLFLINIVRVVLLKSQGPSDLNTHSEGAHIKKALRATIILFPLLGNALLGSISSTFYTKLLLVQIPNVQRRQSSEQCLFALLGPTHVKAAHTMTMKSTLMWMLLLLFLLLLIWCDNFTVVAATLFLLLVNNLMIIMLLLLFLLLLFLWVIFLLMLLLLLLLSLLLLLLLFLMVLLGKSYNHPLPFAW